MVLPGPQEFWDNKIVQWESDRYEPVDSDRPFMEKVANQASSSLRHRIALAEKMISSVCNGKHIVEIGCGSGRMAKKLIDAGAKSYTGYDISTEAINVAKSRSQEPEYVGKINFIASEVSLLPALKADIVVSLGLFDWLSDEDIYNLFQKSSGAWFLHSFSEKRLSLGQWAHRLYVQVAYGHQTGSYRPRYQSKAELVALAQPHTKHNISVYRARGLAFGAFLMSLPHLESE